MPTRDEQIGQRVRELRKSAGLTQRQLAGITGRHLQNWASKIEAGCQPLLLADAILIAAGLGVPLTALAGSEEGASTEVARAMEKSIRWRIAQQVLAGGPK